MLRRLFGDRLFDSYETWLKKQAYSKGLHATSKWHKKQTQKNEKKVLENFWKYSIECMKTTQICVLTSQA